MTRSASAMEDELLPKCPICKSDAEHDSRRWHPDPDMQRHPTGHTGHSYYCSNPSCDVGLFDTEEEARAAWTRAMPAAPAGEALKAAIIKELLRFDFVSDDLVITDHVREAIAGNICNRIAELAALHPAAPEGKGKQS